MSSSANSNFFPFFDYRMDALAPIEHVFDKVFNDLSDFSIENIRKTAYPKWDIYYTNDEYVIEVAASGCDVNDLNVEIMPTESVASTNKKFNRILKVSGRVAQDYQKTDQSKTRYICRELKRSAFERMVYLPNDITGDPEAVMSRGVLTLRWKLPKEEKKKLETKKIEIKSFD